jgi:hypothetical protein
VEIITTQTATANSAEDAVHTGVDCKRSRASSDKAAAWPTRPDRSLRASGKAQIRFRQIGCLSSQNADPLAPISNDEVHGFHHGVGFLCAIAETATVAGDAQVDVIRPALGRDEALQLRAAHDLVAYVDDFRAARFPALLTFAFDDGFDFRRAA